MKADLLGCEKLRSSNCSLSTAMGVISGTGFKGHAAGGVGVEASEVNKTGGSADESAETKNERVHQ